jgi:hypothetical protein
LGTGNKSSVGVLVECTSRLLLLANMEDATAVFAMASELPIKAEFDFRPAAQDLHLRPGQRDGTPHRTVYRYKPWTWNVAVDFRHFVYPEDPKVLRELASTLKGDLIA